MDDVHLNASLGQPACQPKSVTPGLERDWAPNLVARLQGLARPGKIVIAASTRRLIGNAFELTDLGDHDLKGVAEPLHCCCVEHALVMESRFDANRGCGMRGWIASCR